MALKNILTVDVEDWYHICDIEHILPSSLWDRCESRILTNCERILNLFSRFRVRATFFVLGYIAEKNPELLKMIFQEGHEIASHGYGHLQVYKQTKEEFLQDLLYSKNLLEGIVGEKVVGYRAPQWSICGSLKQADSSPLGFMARPGQGRRSSYWALDLLVQNGFFYDSSIAPLRFIGIPNAPTIPYRLLTPHGEIREFPPLIMPSPFGNLPIGGGWGFRIFPYHKIQRSIDKYNQLGYPALLFCHPSDFDFRPLPIHLPWIKRFVCYGKIRTTEERMNQVLSDFEFGSIREFLSSENNKLPFQNTPFSFSPKGEG
jgi:peptidoglycan/xylan/chitin deacetylase (PgdA/CDA1 family)